MPKNTPKVKQSVVISDRPEVFRQDTALNEITVDENNVMTLWLQKRLSADGETVLLWMLKQQHGERFTDFQIRYKVGLHQ